MKVRPVLTVGIPKEIKPREKRVGLTPQGVYELSRTGISVLVQRGAGIGSDFKDEDYKASGAKIVPSAAALYQKAGLIQKVKEPLSPEFRLLRKNQILFCFLHLASPEHCKLVQALLKSKVTAIGYETVEREGRMPLLAPMSEIAGALSASFAAFLRNQKLIQKSKIIYPKKFQENLEALAKVYPAYPMGLHIGKTVIWGGGAAGQKAAEFALNMKGKVTLIEINPLKRDVLKKIWGNQTRDLVVIAPEAVSEKVLADADIFIGCVHRAGERAQQVMDVATLKKASAKKKKIVMDISIDQGGNFPEARATDYDNPLYLDSFQNVRFAVFNIPSLCGRAASEALTQSTIPYTLALARNFTKALKDFPELGSAVNVKLGRIIHPAIRKAHQR